MEEMNDHIQRTKHMCNYIKSTLFVKQNLPRNRAGGRSLSLEKVCKWMKFIKNARVEFEK